MTGIVKSTKMDKAIVIEVTNTKTHSKYKKSYKTVKRYTVACLDSKKFKVGDSVEVISCKPVSKTIKFKVVED